MNEIQNRVGSLIEQAEREVAAMFEKVDEIERVNTRKVLESFKRHRVASRHFAPSTGYGYDDIGRDALSAIMAELMGAEAALVRPQIASGTHALALCLYGVLRPGDVLLSAAGKPYDTLEEVIGLAGTAGNGSLKDYNIGYRQAELSEGRMDVGRVLAQMDDKVKLVLMQRSSGYDWRPSLAIGEMRAAIQAIHAERPRALVMVDNCYGEFTDVLEPGDLGADLFAGSMIKNPGGGLAPTGGYVAGKKNLVELVSYRLTSPGIGAEVGSYAGGYQSFYQGLFQAPHAVAQALKTAILAARAFEKLGFAVNPPSSDMRSDIIQAIRFEDAAKMIAFIQAIQAASPVDSDAMPEPWTMPGYQDPVIMAAGTFVSGASIELSADGPVRPPYIAYLQGALTYQHGRLGIEGALTQLASRGLVEL